MTDVLLGAILALNVIGGYGLVKWLRKHIGALQGTVTALERTVAAQDETLKTVRGLNTTVLEIFKAMDPERWAKEVQIHKKLADERAAAIVEDERRRFEQEKGKTTEVMMGNATGFVRLVLELMPYVPKAERQRLIEGLTISGMPRRIALDAAEKTTDWSAGRGLARLLRGDLDETLFKDPPDAPGEPPRATGQKFGKTCGSVEVRELHTAHRARTSESRTPPGSRRRTPRSTCWSGSRRSRETRTRPSQAKGGFGWPEPT